VVETGGLEMRFRYLVLPLINSLAPQYCAIFGGIRADLGRIMQRIMQHISWLNSVGIAAVFQ